MQVNIVIPSYKRAGRVTPYKYFKNSKICIPAKQRGDYLKYYSAKRLIVIPDENDGNIARKRNWILKNIKRPVLMLDDDVKCLVTVEKGHRAKLEKIRLDPDEAMRVIINGFNLAYSWDCVLWGLNINMDKRSYYQQRPFGLSNVILGPFQGHLYHDLFYDERIWLKEDYDFSLQALAKYRKILRINKYTCDCLHAVNPGGVVSHRSQKNEIENCNAIMKKWGKKVIKYKIPPSKPADLLNAKINIPIRGV